MMANFSPSFSEQDSFFQTRKIEQSKETIQSCLCKAWVFESEAGGEAHHHEVSLK